MLALRWLLVLIVLWLVNQIHLPASFGVKGLNAMNVLVLVAVVLVMVQNRGLPPSRTKTPLQAPILLFFFALAYALVIGLLSDASAMSADFTIFKTGVFYISLYFLFYHGVRDVATIRLLVWRPCISPFFCLCSWRWRFICATGRWCVLAPWAAWRCWCLPSSSPIRARPTPLWPSSVC